MKTILLLLSLLSLQAKAQFSGGLGVFSHNMMRTSSTPTAEASFLGTTYFPMIIKYQTQPYWYDLKFAPYLSFTHLTTMLVPVETPDKTAKRNFAILALPLVYPFSEQWSFSFGPGLIRYELKGKGGSKQVNNGTGTSTFKAPGKTVSSHLLLLELGFANKIGEWTWGVDLYLSGLASERRAYSGQITVAYNFGGLL